VEIKENEAALKSATDLRKEANEAFIAEEADLTEAIGQMKDALTTLAAVGGDQTAGTSAEHKQFMAGKGSLVKLQSVIKQALLAASSHISKTQHSVVDSFLQRVQRGPGFTGSYSSQSGQVVGILKNMQDTFERNLESARTTEKKDQDSFDKYETETKVKIADMKSLVEDKQSTLATNDEDLGSKTTARSASQENADNSQAFLNTLRPSCAAKTKEYNTRVQLRMEEETAISEALAILNSDAAFANFDKVGKIGFSQVKGTAKKQISAAPVASTRPISFVQVKSYSTSVPAVQVRRRAVHEENYMPNVQALLETASSKKFDICATMKVVVAKLDETIEIIDGKKAADTKDKNYYKKEHEEKTALIEDQEGQMASLKSNIDDLEKTISELEANIADTESSLQTTLKNEADTIKARKEDVAIYDEKIAQIAEAKSVVDKATKVLELYYTKVNEGEAPEQVDIDEEAMGKMDLAVAAPGADAFTGKYEGQSGGDGGGNKVIELLTSISGDLSSDAGEKHEAEATNQQTFEDEMTEFKDAKKSAREELARMKTEKAESEETASSKREELATTASALGENKRYLREEIKPEHDYWEANFEDRMTKYGEEKTGIEDSKKQLMDTPNYKNCAA